MPDRDNWTAAMVLKWVLVRDLPTVLGMAETYGADIVFVDGTSRPAVPENVDAVMSAYCTDPTPLGGEEGVRRAVLRFHQADAGRNEIYRALRQGKLEARARRNGSGDVEAIVPDQWLLLKFHSWNGHDLAAPINIDQDVLDLPWPIEDYLHGRVPADAQPVVWPDPLLAAEQVMQIWPPDVLKDTSASAEGPPRLIEPADQPVLESARAHPERPEGLSDGDWQTYLSAVKKGYDLDIRGNTTKAARSIARERGHGGHFASERRALHRVRKKISEQRSIEQIER